VFHKLCRIAQSSRAHRTESVSVMGHAWSATVCCTKWDKNSETSLSRSLYSGARLRYCQIARSVGDFTVWI